MDSALSIKKEKVYYFLFKFMVVLAIFDGIRHNSIFFSFSILKELVTFMLLGILLIEKKFRIDNPAKNLEYAFFIYYLITIGTLLTLGNVNLLSETLRKTPPINPMALHLKTLEFFLLIYIFKYFTFLTSRPIEDIIAFFINVYVVYIIFNIISYFYHFPFITEFRPYAGRISSGYPTSDSQSMSFAFTFLVLSKGDFRNYIIKFLILALGIVIQATTTGIATLAYLIGVFFFFSNYLVGKEGRKKNILSLLYIFGIVFILLTTVVIYIDKETLDRFWVMLTSKTEFIIYFFKLKVLGIEGETGHYLVTGTYERRGEVVGQVMSVYNDPFNLLIGKGTALASVVENQFSFTIRAYGYLGFTFYVVFLLGLLFNAWKRGKRNMWYMLIVVGILTLTNASQITSYLFQIGVSFALAVNYCLNISADTGKNNMLV